MHEMGKNASPANKIFSSPFKRLRNSAELSRQWWYGPFSVEGALDTLGLSNEQAASLSQQLASVSRSRSSLRVLRSDLKANAIYTTATPGTSGLLQSLDYGWVFASQSSRSPVNVSRLRPTRDTPRSHLPLHYSSRSRLSTDVRHRSPTCP